MKRLLAVLLSACMLLSATVLFASIAENNTDENPFDDVPGGKWYTESVLWCYRNKYMVGKGERRFEPDGIMTRAMIVTVFAAVSGEDISDAKYSHSTFTDVHDGSWYTNAVAWAEQNYVASGTGGGRFSPEMSVSREQFVKLLYNFISYLGIETEYQSDSYFRAFGDRDKVSGWATESLKWAAENELISGTGTYFGVPNLSPLMLVSRAQAAAFIKNAFEKNIGGEYPLGSLSLGGVDISEFTIVYGEDFKNIRVRDRMNEVADFLKSAIENATGITLPVYKDSEREAISGAHEILIGITDREEKGFVTVDRSGFEKPSFIYEMKGNYLILTCPQDLYGAGKAAAAFLEDICGVTYFGSNIYTYASLKSASIEDGVRVTGTSAYSNVEVEDGDQFLGAFGGDDAMMNLSHSLPLLGCPGCEYGTEPTYQHHLNHYLGSDPCLSDPDSIDTIIKNVRYILEHRAGIENEKEVIVHVSQSDSARNCMCEHCRDIYKLWGSGATYVQIMTYVSEALSAEYPNVKFIAYGCDHTANRPKLASEISDEKYAEFLAKYGDLKYVPKKDITPPKNAILLLKADDACESHAFDDPNCERNAAYVKRVEKWCELYDTIYVNCFTGSKIFIYNPFPDVYEAKEILSFFTRYENYDGVRYFAFNDAGYDHRKLRSFLSSRVIWEPDMTDAEYSALINRFLKAAYGAGWTYAREYIDKTEELSSENHFWTYKGVGDRWDSIITKEQWNENYDYCSNLVNKTIELADSEKQLREAELTSVTHDYIGCQLAYAKYKETGLESDLAAFSVLSEAFHEKLLRLDIFSPPNWSPTLDPDLWQDD